MPYFDIWIREMMGEEQTVDGTGVAPYMVERELVMFMFKEMEYKPKEVK